MILYKKMKRAYAEEVGDPHFMVATLEQTDWVEDSSISDEDLMKPLEEKYPTGSWVKVYIEYGFVPFINVNALKEIIK